MKLCECGCGEPAPIAAMTSRRRGAVKGEPQRFIRGHRHRSRRPEYVVDAATGCWVWQRAQHEEGGYGTAWDTILRRQVPAHRFIYERLRGPIPDGLTLDHLCRNPSCVNPDHLEPVTHVENVRRGPNIKLTEADVIEIRRRAAAGESKRELAEEFGISAVHARSLCRGDAWRIAA